MTERTFPLTGADAEVVFHALSIYASDLLESFVEDDESPALEDARHASDLARRLQEWIVANHQTLARDSSG